MERRCGDCWWEDAGTGICCNEESENNLVQMGEGEVCPLWCAREPEARAEGVNECRRA